MRMPVRHETEVALAFEGSEYREAHLVQGDADRLYTCPVRHMRQGQHLSFGMRMVVIVGRMRVYYHHPVHIVDVREYRDARLIGHEQHQQHHGDEYVLPLLHSFFLKSGAKVVFLC